MGYVVACQVCFDGKPRDEGIRLLTLPYLGEGTFLSQIAEIKISNLRRYER